MPAGAIVDVSVTAPPWLEVQPLEASDLWTLPVFEAARADDSVAATTPVAGGSPVGWDEATPGPPLPLGPGALRIPASPSASGPPRVTWAGPRGEQLVSATATAGGDNAAVMVAFDREIDAPAAGIVALEPQPEGRWRWRSPSVVAFEQAAGRLPMATHFRARVTLPNAEPRQGLGWEFATPPAVPLEISPDGGVHGAQTVFVIRFNQPVAPQAVGDVCRLTVDGASVPFVASQPPDATHRVILAPVTPLPAGGSVTLRVGPHIPALEGSRFFDETRSATFHVAGPMDAIGARCGYSSGCRPGDVWTVELSNALEPESIRQGPVEPEYLGLPARVGPVSIHARGRYLTFGVPGGTPGSWTLQLPPSLRDRWGQGLSRGDPIEITIGGFHDAVALPGAGPIATWTTTRIPVRLRGDGAWRVRAWAVEHTQWPAWLAYNRVPVVSRRVEPPGRLIVDTELSGTDVRDGAGWWSGAIDVGSGPTGTPAPPHVIVVAEPVGPADASGPGLGAPARAWAGRWVNLTRLHGGVVQGDVAATVGVFDGRSAADGARVTLFDSTGARAAEVSANAMGVAIVPLPAGTVPASVRWLLVRRGNDELLLPDRDGFWAGPGKFRRKRALARVEWDLVLGPQTLAPGQRLELAGRVTLASGASGASGTSRSGQSVGSAAARDSIRRVKTVAYTLRREGARSLRRGKLKVSRGGRVRLSAAVPATAPAGRYALTLIANVRGADKGAPQAVHDARRVIPITIESPVGARAPDDQLAWVASESSGTFKVVGPAGPWRLWAGTPQLDAAMAARFARSAPGFIFGSGLANSTPARSEDSPGDGARTRGEGAARQGTAVGGPPASDALDTGANLAGVVEVSGRLEASSRRSHEGHEGHHKDDSHHERQGRWSHPAPIQWMVSAPSGELSGCGSASEGCRVWLGIRGLRGTDGVGWAVDILALDGSTGEGVAGVNISLVDSSGAVLCSVVSRESAVRCHGVSAPSTVTATGTLASGAGSGAGAGVHGTATSALAIVNPAVTVQLADATVAEPPPGVAVGPGIFAVSDEPRWVRGAAGALTVYGSPAEGGHDSAIWCGGLRSFRLDDGAVQLLIPADHTSVDFRRIHLSRLAPSGDVVSVDLDVPMVDGSRSSGSADSSAEPLAELSGLRVSVGARDGVSGVEVDVQIPHTAREPGGDAILTLSRLGADGPRVVAWHVLGSPTGSSWPHMFEGPWTPGAYRVALTRVRDGGVTALSKDISVISPPRLQVLGPQVVHRGDVSRLAVSLSGHGGGSGEVAWSWSGHRGAAQISFLAKMTLPQLVGSLWTTEDLNPGKVPLVAAAKFGPAAAISTRTMVMVAAPEPQVASPAVSVGGPLRGGQSLRWPRMQGDPRAEVVVATTPLVAAVPAWRALLGDWGGDPASLAGRLMGVTTAMEADVPTDLLNTALPHGAKGWRSLAGLLVKSLVDLQTDEGGWSALGAVEPKSASSIASRVQGAGPPINIDISLQVAHALAMASRQGATLPKLTRDRLARYLAGLADEGLDAQVSAYVAYVRRLLGLLSRGSVQADAAIGLGARIRTVEGAAWLWLALRGNRDARRLLSRLKRRWSRAGKDLRDVSVRGHAALLLAAGTSGSTDAAALAEGVQLLRDLAGPAGHWRSPRDNGYGVLSLTRVLSSVASPRRTRLKIGIEGGSASASAGLGSPDGISWQRLDAGSGPWVLSAQGKGSVWFNLAVSSSGLKSRDPMNSGGLGVDRQLPRPSSRRLGDRVEVILTLQVREPISGATIYEPVVAGLGEISAIASGAWLLDQRVAPGDGASEGWRRWRVGALEPGVYTITYEATAALPGVWTVAPPIAIPDHGPRFRRRSPNPAPRLTITAD